MKMQTVASSYTETYWNTPCSCRVHSGNRMHLSWSGSCTSYILSNCNHQGVERKKWSPEPAQLHYIMPAFVPSIHYSIKYQVGITLAFPPVFALLFLSFPCHIFSPTPRWGDGSQCQIRDDVSPLPWAPPTGASYPQSEGGTGKGERSRSSGKDWNLQSYFRHALSSSRKFTGRLS